jgi:DnaK suppressor protein
MPFLSDRRTLGPTVQRPRKAAYSIRQSIEVFSAYLRPFERTRHVTSTVHDPVEMFRDILEEQFQRHTGQLSELIMCTQQPDRGGYDEETLIALTVSSRRALADTAAALRRMAEGTYGICKRCAVSISLDRLQTVPDAPFCLSCQRTRTD